MHLYVGMCMHIRILIGMGLTKAYYRQVMYRHVYKHVQTHMFIDMCVGMCISIEICMGLNEFACWSVLSRGICSSSSLVSCKLTCYSFSF